MRCSDTISANFQREPFDASLFRLSYQSSPIGILAVTTFYNQPSGIAAFALVTTTGAFYAYRTLHSLGWHIAFGTAVCGKLAPSRIFDSASA
jgi:hypothetical protein